MEVDIFVLKSLLIKILKRKGLNQSEATIIADEYWEAEISGKKTHGIAKFLKELRYVADRKGSPSIIIDNKAVVLVDANKEIGQLGAKFCIDILINRTKRYGIGLIGMKNSQRYGSLSFWANRIAQANLVGIITNSCEPATAVFGGITPILGTNPIAIGIPTFKEPIVLDMATSKVSMSTLLYSAIYNKFLPKETFLDNKGNYTTDPTKVVAVEHFGGYKGFGLSFMLQILSGALISANMGKDIHSPYDAGYYFQAIDPSIFQDIKLFKKHINQFVFEVKASKLKKGFSKIIIPGERSKNLKQQNIKKGTIEISLKLFKNLNREAN